MQQRGRTSLLEDLLNLATRLPWWMDLMIAVFAYIAFHLWHVHFLHEMNPINEPVPVPVVANCNDLHLKTLRPAFNGFFDQR